MPTYEYECEKCGKRLEKFQSMTSEPLKKCPACGKNALKRLISGGAGLIFKGSGFYITDYRDSNYKDAAKADTAPAKSEGTSTESKPAADAKPASDSKPTEAAKPAAEAKPKPDAKPPAASKSAAKASTKGKNK
jgi:putative FmdB family regulatory protein